MNRSGFGSGGGSSHIGSGGGSLRSGGGGTGGGLRHEQRTTGLQTVLSSAERDTCERTPDSGEVSGRWLMHGHGAARRWVAPKSLLLGSLSS